MNEVNSSSRTARALQDLDAEREIEISLLPGTDVVVAALIEQRRQPADLQLQANDFEQIGVLQKKQKTRFRLDEVRVLIALADGDDLDAIAADFTGDRRRIFRRRDDFQFVGGKQIAADEE